MGKLDNSFTGDFVIPIAESKCIQNAFEFCPYKNRDEAVCSECICSAIDYLKKCLRKLK